MDQGPPARHVEVLRLGHRPGRDPRLSTHLALTARAFGAQLLHLEPPDPALARRVGETTARFGGGFQVVGQTSWRGMLRAWKGTSVHLTMYGEDLDDVLPKVLASPSPYLVVVGGPKVPKEVYELATFNVAVTHQPHSEVAALAITLDRLLGTPRLELRAGARLQVKPHPRGKAVVDLGGEGGPPSTDPKDEPDEGPEGDEGSEGEGDPPIADPPSAGPARRGR